jgi:hypothetical protein
VTYSQGMWRAWFRPLFLGCLGIAVTPQVQAQGGGGGRGEGCIGLSMPCLYGPASDPSCAARARAARPGPIPEADCRLLGIGAPGLSRDALAWLQARVRSETLPAVCSCYREGLSINPRLRGRLSVPVRMNQGCGQVEASPGSALPDRYVLDCIHGRFIGFPASPPSTEFPPVVSPFAAELTGKRFTVQIDLRPQPRTPPASPAASPTGGAGASRP